MRCPSALSYKKPRQTVLPLPLPFRILQVLIICNSLDKKGATNTPQKFKKNNTTPSLQSYTKNTRPLVPNLGNWTFHLIKFLNHSFCLSILSSWEELCFFFVIFWASKFTPKTPLFCMRKRGGGEWNRILDNYKNIVQYGVRVNFIFESWRPSCATKNSKKITRGVHPLMRKKSYELPPHNILWGRYELLNKIW